MAYGLSNGHMIDDVTWPRKVKLVIPIRLDTPYVISYWWSFGTESLSPAVFEILRSKRIGVAHLTFQGHVVSSVT